MDSAPQAPIVRSVEEVFNDFLRRREGLIKALTTEADKFLEECDPEKENLCLYGLPDGSWEVNLPVEEVPPELPEPVLGINFARDGMQQTDWLSLVAVHSDSWLLSVAFYFGARFGFDKNDRRKLFRRINDVPTVFEVVSGKKPKELSAAQIHGSKSKPSGKMSRSSEPHPKAVRISPPPNENDGAEEQEEAEEEADDEQGATLCGACGDIYTADDEEFWIGCDACERWFHGKCVKITPAKAEHIKHYKCPSCSSKRARVHI